MVAVGGGGGGRGGGWWCTGRRADEVNGRRWWRTERRNMGMMTNQDGNQWDVSDFNLGVRYG